MNCANQEDTEYSVERICSADGTASRKNSVAAFQMCSSRLKRDRGGTKEERESTSPALLENTRAKGRETGSVLIAPVEQEVSPDRLFCSCFKGKV